MVKAGAHVKCRPSREHVKERQLSCRVHVVTPVQSRAGFGIDFSSGKKLGCREAIESDENEGGHFLTNS